MKTKFLVFAAMLALLTVAAVKVQSARADYAPCPTGWEVDPGNPTLCRQPVSVPAVWTPPGTTQIWVLDAGGHTILDTRTVTDVPGFPAVTHQEYLIDVVTPAWDETIHHTNDNISYMYERDGNSDNCRMQNQYKSNPDHRQAPWNFPNNVQNAYYGQPKSCHVTASWDEVIHHPATTNQAWVLDPGTHTVLDTRTVTDSEAIPPVTHVEYLIEQETSEGFYSCPDLSYTLVGETCQGWVYMRRGELPSGEVAITLSTAIPVAPEWPKTVIPNLTMYYSPTGFGANGKIKACLLFGTPPMSQEFVIAPHCGKVPSDLQPGPCFGPVLQTSPTDTVGSWACDQKLQQLGFTPRYPLFGEGKNTLWYLFNHQH